MRHLLSHTKGLLDKIAWIWSHDGCGFFGLCGANQIQQPESFNLSSIDRLKGIADKAGKFEMQLVQ